MDNLFFSEYSIGRFSHLILTLIVALFLFFKKEKSASTRCLLITFISLFLFSLGYFIANSLYSPLGSLGWYITAFGSFGPIAFIQFAYRFPAYHYKKESTVVLGLSSGLFLLSIVDYCYFSLQTPIVATVTHYGSTYASRFLPVYWVAANIWTVVVLIRQSRKTELEHASAGHRPDTPGGVLFPKERLARAARNFAVLVILELSLSISIALFMNLHITSLSTFHVISSGGMLIISFMYVVVYVNNSPETSTFMAKLVGISLVTVFLVIGGMSNVVMIHHDTTYTDVRKAQLPYIGELIARKGTDFPDDLRFILAFENPRGRGSATIMYSRNPAFQLSEPPRFWDRPPTIRQLILLKDKGSDLVDSRGKMRDERFYTRIHDEIYLYFSFMKDGVRYGAGYDFIQYRMYMHKKATAMLLIISAAALLILFIYPILFYTGLVLPINKLLQGVRNVDDGDLNVSIPIQFMDEIGHVSVLFNKMVASIREKNKNLDDYAANLEKKVMERTRELESERSLLFKRNEIIEHDLSLARKIQLGLVPKTSPVSYLSHLYKPMEKVGGDFYDFIRLANPNTIGILICDVSGHGVPAALITSMIKSAILQSGDRKENPAEFLGYMNDLLINQTAGNFITAFYGIYDPNDRSLRYSNAGHPLPYLITDDGITQLPKGNGTALAVFPNSILAKSNKSYRLFEALLPVHAKLLLYTDGLTEALSMQGTSIFENANMLDVLSSNRNMSSEHFISGLYKSLIAFKGENTFEDDISLICLEVL